MLLFEIWFVLICLVKEAKETTDEEFQDIVEGLIDDFVNDSSPTIFLLYYEGPCVQVSSQFLLSLR